jgi:hypothetical protein
VCDGELGGDADDESEDSAFGGGVDSCQVEVAEELDDWVSGATVDGFEDGGVGEAEALTDRFGIF